MQGNREITERQALSKLMTLCARSEHCTGELLQKMRLWGLADDVQARIIERLVRERFVDDERYTRAFVSDKIKYNQWGRRKIEQALWAKGVDRAVQQKVLDETDENEYLSVLRPLLKSKVRSISGRNEFERQMKLIRFAQGRGFTMQQIQCCLDVDSFPED